VSQWILITMAKAKHEEIPTSPPKKEKPFYDTEIVPRLESFITAMFSIIIHRKGLYGEYSDQLFSLQDKFGVDVPVGKFVILRA